jgi:hypothetical protein
MPLLLKCEEKKIKFLWRQKEMGECWQEREGMHGIKIFTYTPYAALLYPGS